MKMHLSLIAGILALISTQAFAAPQKIGMHIHVAECKGLISGIKSEFNFYQEVDDTQESNPTGFGFAIQKNFYSETESLQTVLPIEVVTSESDLKLKMYSPIDPNDLVSELVLPTEAQFEFPLVMRGENVGTLQCTSLWFSEDLN